MCDGRLRRCDPDRSGPEIGHLDRALADAGKPPEWLREFHQFGQPLLLLGRIAQANRDGVIADGQGGVADAGLAQRAPRPVEHSLKHFLLHGMGIDLEQKVRAALQVEPEIDVDLRPIGPASREPCRQEIQTRHHA